MYTEGTLFDGRYLLKERKGRGSFGEVWLAEDTEIGVDFAIKIYVAMDQKGLEEFRKEYQLSCNLINSNLLHINKMEVSKSDGCPYLVMPYCPRGASSLIGQMTEKELWHFFHDVANGLAYLHEQTPPIIHQDIKPDNILQMQSGDYVITDFGISKQLRGTRRSAGGDSSGAVAYMGPERFKAGYTSIKSSDIWSLGATIYEMATGLLPFEGKGGKMQDAGFETPLLPSQFSKELNDAMQSCMKAEPWDRPSARQIAEYAAEMMKGRATTPAPQPVAPQTVQRPVQQSVQQPVPQPTPKPTPQPAPQPSVAGKEAASSKTPVIAVAAVAVVAVLGVLVFLLFGGKSEGDGANVAQTEVQQVAPEPQNPTVENVQNVEPQEASSTTEEIEPAAPVQEAAKPVEAPKENKPAAETKKTEAPAAETKKPAPAAPAEPAAKSGNGNMKLSYGTYTGSIKGGYPNGKGKLVYTTSRQINKYDSKARTAQPGDYVEGLFVNGFFTTGKHYSADGTLIESISVGVAEGVFESK